MFTATEIGGSESIMNPLVENIANQTDPTIQPTMVHFEQPTGPRHSYQKQFSIGSFNSGIDVPRPGQNIDNFTGMNPQGPIVTTIPESNIANNCGIIDLVSRILDIAYRGSPWHGKVKNESENIRGNKCFKNAERKNNFEVEKVGRKTNVSWNHTNSIIN